MAERQLLAEREQGRYSRTWAVLNDYLTLTKPPIILLLLITAAGGMFLAAKGIPSLPLLGLVWVGGALASAGANAINHQLDRDIDLIMSRTRHRPVADQRITPTKALIFGILLNILAFLFHGFLTFCDDAYRLIRATLPTRKIFFEHIRALTHYICFPSWEALMDFMMRGLEIGPYEVK